MRRLLPLILLAGCLEAPARVDTEHLDLGFYECNVQPIFDRSCAFVACHGDPGRPLFLYSMSKTRIVAEELIGERLTDKELCLNYEHAAAFARADGSSELITKPSTLDGAGSLYHEGNYMFGPGDVEGRCLETWIRGARTGTAAAPPPSCYLPWRAGAGAGVRCRPRNLDCKVALAGPDLPEP